MSDKNVRPRLVDEAANIETGMLPHPFPESVPCIECVCVTDEEVSFEIANSEHYDPVSSSRPEFHWVTVPLTKRVRELTDSLREEVFGNCDDVALDLTKEQATELVRAVVSAAWFGDWTDSKDMEANGGAT